MIELLKEIESVCSDILSKNENFVSPIPLFSFEGLPGSGKTTQIKRVADFLKDNYGKVAFIDLPTENGVGSILKSAYKSSYDWNVLRKKVPWLNPVLLSVDLKFALKKAANDNAICALMSRGILSTYYYNIDAFEGDNLDAKWIEMEKYMVSFPYPQAIFFLEVSPEIARNRVLKRNREPIRPMDNVDQMKEDRLKFKEYYQRLPSIPLHFVDAEKTENEVTLQIADILKGYMK